MLVIDLFYCSLLFSIVLAETEHTHTYDLTIKNLHKVMVDPQYVDLGNIRVNRMNRTTIVISGSIQTKVEVDNSVLVTILLYVKSGTEYKRSAAASYKDKPICEFMNSRAMGVREFIAASNFPEKCPVPPTTYEVKNYILGAEHFPVYIPESDYRADILITQDDILWLHVQVFVQIHEKFVLTDKL